MNAVSTTPHRRDVFVRPRFGLAGAALLTAICLVALALTGSGPGSKSADADVEPADAAAADSPIRGDS